MSDKPVKIPGPEHPIGIMPEPRRVVVRAGGRVIADSRRAVSLKAASCPAVVYIPREDADMTQLEAADHATYCPYKGDCAYFSIPAAGARGTNAVWSYERPFPAAAAIAGRLAFYPDRVDSIAFL